MAAVEALEAAGYHVTLPPKGLCCGRPLYDFGMIDRAKRYLLEVLDALRDDLRAGVRVVGIEPSCLAVFRDELRSLLPRDEDAARLVGQAVHFAELLEQTEGWEPPRLEWKAIFHGHCHQRATGGIEPELRILERMGVEVELPQSGCCGLAGSFGFTAEHYELSIAIGERVLLPAVREAPDDWLLVANGFSCATQIEQGDTGRRALHLAEVLQLAREHEPELPPGRRPEEWTVAPPTGERRRKWPLAALANRCRLAPDEEARMKAQRLDESRVELVFEQGDEVVSTLLAYAGAYDLTVAHVTAIGAFSDVELAYFDWERKEYLPIPIDEQVEVLVLAGDIASKDGEPAVHAHVVVGKRDGTAHGGHLLEAHVRPMLELILETSPAHLRRRVDEETGLTLIDPGAA